MRMTLALAAIAAMASGCWNGVQVVEDGKTTHDVRLPDMKCTKWDCDLTDSNAVFNIVFERTGR